MKEKIYISGPITGKKNGNLKNFTRVERKLKKLNFRPVNPRRLTGYSEQDGYNFKELKKSLHLMLKCNKIYFMKGWEKSKGCNIEYYLAANMEYEFFYESKKYGKQL